jgi:hypothetical protein
MFPTSGLLLLDPGDPVFHAVFVDEEPALKVSVQHCTMSETAMIRSSPCKPGIARSDAYAWIDPAKQSLAG